MIGSADEADAGAFLVRLLRLDPRTVVRLRPRPSLSAILEGRSGLALPDGIDHLIARTTVEILTLRPTMSLGLGSPARE